LASKRISMAKIAIVDDNREQRETLGISLKLYLKKKNSSLKVIDIFPFQSYERYFPWIDQEEICVLILDERLHNDSEGELGPVGYKGNDLVVKIRERYKDLPIFTVTAHIDDEELQARFNEFDYIISRDNFDEKYVDIIIRASQRYLKENQEELSEFDDLTKKIAAGQGNADDIEKLKALQMKLQLPLLGDLKEREDWLKEYENQIESLDLIKRTLEQKLKK
jgi:DNA-binding NtrC family response regulator